MERVKRLENDVIVGSNPSFSALVKIKNSKIKQSRLCFLLLIALLSITQGQESFQDEFMTSNYFLYKLVWDGNSNQKSDLTTVNEKLGNIMPNFELKIVIYDPKKAEQKQIKNIARFKKNDTVMIYDWDLQDRAFPILATCQYKLNTKDSSLVLYNIQNASKTSLGSEKFKYQKRTFKIISQSKNEFILLDKNFIDIRREYHFKKIVKSHIISK